MRFKQIEIPAFGPFTNLELAFPDAPGDLHVIYGANEAGKSSLLRAIRDLLFGIHGQSSDNFLHDYKELRLKGRLRNRAGVELSFQRRKGNKNTLLDAAGGVLPEAALAPFLGGVDQAYFSTMFGLGARELSEGAQQLLRGEGAMGQALFSASMGGTPVQKVLETLKAEADRIFKGRATANVSLRPAANRYKELLKQSREAVVDPDTWKENEEALAKADGEKRRLEGELAALERELSWVERCEAALPSVVALDEGLGKLAALPVLPEVASDFIGRVREARKTLAQTQAEVGRLTEQANRIRTQLEACPVASALLAQGQALDQLHQSLSIYRDRKKTVASLREQIAACESALAAGMRDLGLEGAFAALEERRVSAAMRLACEEAAEALQEAARQESVAGEKAEAHSRQSADRERDLAALAETSLDAIREALAVAAEATDADKTIGASESELRRQQKNTTALHRSLVGAPADFEATVRLPVPSPATIRRHSEDKARIEREIVAEEKTQWDAQRQLENLGTELARLQRRGELPTESALLDARKQRDRGWELVLAEWKGDGAVEELVPGTPLEEAFPRTIAKADAIADGLWKNAEAVAQADEKRLQIRVTQQHADEAGRRLAAHREAMAKWEAEWAAVWAPCALLPRLPAEMEEWRAQWCAFCDSHAKLAEVQGDVARKSAQIHAARRRLAEALGDSDQKEFAVLFAAGRKFVQEGEQAAGERKALAKQLADLRAESAKEAALGERCRQAAAQAAEQWKTLCKAVGLPEGISPKAGLTLIAKRCELLRDYDEWKAASAKVGTLARDSEQYERQVADMAELLGVGEASTELQEAALWKRLEEARDAERRHRALAEQGERLGTELVEAQARLSAAEQVQAELVRVAGVETADALDPLLVQLERRAAIRTEIDQLRRTLGSHARGQGVDDFVARIRTEDPATFHERRVQAARRKQELGDALEMARQTVFQLGATKRELEKAGDQAADLRQQAELQAAALAKDASRYLRLRLAIQLVEQQIERFRAENQGPLLSRAGAIFSAITGGAFTGLTPEFDANDIPVLVGRRPDQTTVTVGGLSDGSRDQLYLALRLAALERFLEEHEPMPLILDDLLITFDNDRAKAILPQLGELGKRTQILLFTHHEHLVDLCQETFGAGGFHLHRLGTSAGASSG